MQKQIPLSTIIIAVLILALLATTTGIVRYENGILSFGRPSNPSQQLNIETTAVSTPTNPMPVNEALSTLAASTALPGSDQQAEWLGVIEQAGINSSTPEFASLFANSMQTISSVSIEVSRSNIQADAVYCEADLTMDQSLANTTLSRLDKALLVRTINKNPLHNYAFSGQIEDRLIDNKLWYEIKSGMVGCARMIKFGSLVAGIHGQDFFGPVGTTYSVPDGNGEMHEFQNITISADEIPDQAYADAQNALKTKLQEFGISEFQQDQTATRLGFKFPENNTAFWTYVTQCTQDQTCLATPDPATKTVTITPLIAAQNLTVTMNLRAGISFNSNLDNRRAEKITSSRSWINWNDSAIETALMNGADDKASYTMIMQPDEQGIRPLDAVKKEFETLLTMPSTDPVNRPSFYDMMNDARWKAHWNQLAQQAGFTGEVRLVINPIYPRNTWVYQDTIETGSYTQFTTDVCALQNDVSYVKSILDPQNQAGTGFQPDWVWQDMLDAKCFTTNLTGY